MLLVSPEYEGVTESWFSPEFWGECAEPVGAGGRGSAWFIRSPGGQLVLRHYRRGGFAARFSRRRYLFTGYSRTRSFLEFDLLSVLLDRGLPVPKPVGALVSRHGALTYEAALLIERITDGVPMPEHAFLESDALWRRVGMTIGLFHREGLDHVDMNCDNVLVAGEKVYLIDFDRCRLHSEAREDAGWKGDNLRRLHRSVNKRIQSLSAQRRDELWQVLMAGYYEC
ncbi:MAG: 3-deoxy-D-manno-octulosonic acid kinase [Marinobacter sp.]|uniref:3-deoxy-D-manno-octulosonic acid kinase n=1 Tax=Marinobacter sp. TaxID=50741 RepID=UPI0032989FEE